MELIHSHRKRNWWIGGFRTLPNSGNVLMVLQTRPNFNTFVQSKSLFIENQILPILQCCTFCECSFWPMYLPGNRLRSLAITLYTNNNLYHHMYGVSQVECKDNFKVIFDCWIYQPHYIDAVYSVSVWAAPYGGKICYLDWVLVGYFVQIAFAACRFVSMVEWVNMI